MACIYILLCWNFVRAVLLKMYWTSWVLIFFLKHCQKFLPFVVAPLKTLSGHGLLAFPAFECWLLYSSQNVIGRFWGFSRVWYYSWLQGFTRQIDHWRFLILFDWGDRGGNVGFCTHFTSSKCVQMWKLQNSVFWQPFIAGHMSPSKVWKLSENETSKNVLATSAVSNSIHEIRFNVIVT